MAEYQKINFVNKPSTTTPVSADNLNHMEDGIYNAQQAADQAQEGVDALDPRVDLVEQRLDTLIPEGTPTEGNAELIDIRTGGNGVTYPDAGSAVRGQYGELKSALNHLGVADISELEVHNGNPSVSNTWNNINSNYQHIVLPVKPNDVVTIVGGGSVTYFGFLKSYTNAVDGASIDYSSATGFTTKIFNDTTQSQTKTVPSDVNYIFVMVTYNGNNAIPAKIIVNGYDFVKNLLGNIVDIIKSVDDTKGRINTTNSNIASILTIAQRDKYNGNLGADGKYNNVTSAYQLYVIPVNGGEFLQIKSNASEPLNYGALTTFNGVTDGATIPYSSASGWSARRYLDANSYIEATIPADARYIIFATVRNSNDCVPQSLTIDNIDYVKDVYGNIRNVYANNVKWIAMGDSITAGYVSYMNGDTPTSNVYPLKAWVDKVSKLNKWDVTNIGIGGTGYLFDGTDHVDANRGYKVARATDFSSYNMVTLGYGINDWKANQAIGTINDDASAETATTVMQAMKATIEAILTSNPLIKIFVLLPLNCAGYDFNYGSKATNWGLGYRFSNSGTLEEFVQKLIEVCDYYGIQYIDLSHYSVVNRENLLSCLLDGVHPSEDAHTLLAMELSAKITAK